MRCATFTRRYAAASQGRSLPRRRCERAWVVNRSSQGDRFQPMALPEGSAPARHKFAHPPHSLAFALPPLPSSPPPPIAPFPSPAARRAFLAVHQFLLITGPPGGGRRMFSLVRVVSALWCGSARLCFAFGYVGPEGVAMTLLGVYNYGRRLL